MPRIADLEDQVFFFWHLCDNLRLARIARLDDSEEMDELDTLAKMTDHPGLRARCLSLLKADVVEVQQTTADA
jgi:hypothetical protein